MLHSIEHCTSASNRQATWDLFCRVVDNFGDIGVCWRLAADLASRGIAVRLWADDASALAWMAPAACAGVRVAAFDDAAAAEPGDVVIEAFGCDPPPGFVARMAARAATRESPAASAAAAAPPLWINLEYLSAEAWVERSHRLPSPQAAGPGAGVTKWFWFPGFTAGTGGLIRETDLRRRQSAFDAGDWLAAIGSVPRDGERVVSLFCYDSAPVDALLDRLAEAPTLLLATAGMAAQRVAALLGPSLRRGCALRARVLPRLTQLDFDHLLWASDLNFVRGEDSFVRAQYAGRPFVWQAYPQADGAHGPKVAAFLDRFAPATPGVRALFEAWNGLANGRASDSPGANTGPPSPVLPALPDPAAWHNDSRRWRDALLGPDAAPCDLGAALIRFAGVGQ